MKLGRASKMRRVAHVLTCKRKQQRQPLKPVENARIAEQRLRLRKTRLKLIQTPLVDGDENRIIPRATNFRPVESRNEVHVFPEASLAATRNEKCASDTNHLANIPPVVEKAASASASSPSSSTRQYFLGTNSNKTSDAFHFLMAASRKSAEESKSRASPADAFSIMMNASKGYATSNKDAKEINFTASIQRKSKKLPAYKYIHGTSYIVDGFTAPSNKTFLYFLTHFHADHYMGLTRHWDAPLVCSPITARLICRRLHVDSHIVREIRVGQRLPLSGNPGGVVEALCANHCPGAIMFLFHLNDGRRVLHTGDFRYKPSMCFATSLSATLREGGRLNLLYLDTTYCDPRYNFPAVDEVVRSVVEECRILKNSRKTLLLFGAYSIGKERVYLAAAQECDEMLHVSQERMNTLSCIGLAKETLARVTTDPTLARWAVVPMNHLRFDRMGARIRQSQGRFDSCVAFCPTGWAASRDASNIFRTTRSGRLTIHKVPYSEHSSFSELQECVRQLRPEKTIPTVTSGVKVGKILASLYKEI